MPAAAIRARARAEMITEIKAIARRQLATDGANLSLRAVARDMGMVSSAIYRYFPSRDDLLTALIVDGYHALAADAEAADEEVGDRADLRGRWLAVCHAIRRWALAHPAEYALLFGSPVPGYAAPAETTTTAVRIPTVLIRILVDGVAAGLLVDTGGESLPGPVHADLAAVRDALFPGLPETLLAGGALGWTQCFGSVSFELFGHLDGTIRAREEYFDHQMRQMAHLIGLP
ncbi:TetR/AcrR family transcriptional regulator [Solwaraspora sp. WMMD406]|uniref:TetR/AcrR family transcriptional regulator n=1 Tax=Solwaraspora sp. WMMD406 TaxID=3016095 RepID=UPI002417D6C6|nr:TetR/AcrR family transcriptional regulator [Solwaraspora sp. WMMD406]MDG4762861.1 TetR/AcrR family transcriptional regulator [Solwaraspora sp. WMMD406]